MLSRNKFVQLAAVAALTVLFGANASMTAANAQAGTQVAQADQKNMQHSRKGDVRHSSTTARAQAQTEQNTQKSRKSDTRHSSSRNASSDRSRHVISTRTTNRTVVHRDRRVVVRSHSSNSVAFVVLGPRAVYRSYGSGWCRALHSGRHWAPRIGWHRGRHVGAVRCG
jgi:hypothetical protein